MDILIAELFGTMLLVLLGNGVVANVILKGSKGENSGWMVITAGWAFAVTIGVYAVGWVSGGHLNPAVTIGMWSVGNIVTSDLSLYITGQCLGAAIGAVLVWLTYKRHYDQTEDAGLILATFSTGPAIRDTKWNILTEAIGTAVLVCGLMAIFNGNNGLASGFGPYAVGILIYSIGLSLGGGTGFAINPARDLMPRIMHSILPIKNKGGSDWGYAVVPVVGPIIGGVIGAMFYTNILPMITV